MTRSNVGGHDARWPGLRGFCSSAHDAVFLRIATLPVPGFPPGCGASGDAAEARSSSRRSNYKTTDDWLSAARPASFLDALEGSQP